MNGSIRALAALGFGAGLLACGGALAQAQTQETGFYAGASIGQSEAKDMDCAGLPSCDKKDTAWKLFGGYQFNRYIAAEGAYTDLGKVKASGPAGSVEIKSNAWEALAVGSYPIGTTGLAPYIKGGLYRGETKTSGLVSGKETNTDWTAGLGLRYDITRSVAVRAEWQRYNGVDAGSPGGSAIGDSDVDVLSLGALFKF
jgi:OmpA-OmpF porin, OOP family